MAQDKKAVEREIPLLNGAAVMAAALVNYCAVKGFVLDNRLVDPPDANKQDADVVAFAAARDAAFRLWRTYEIYGAMTLGDEAFWKDLPGEGRKEPEPPSHPVAAPTPVPPPVSPR